MRGAGNKFSKLRIYDVECILRSERQGRLRVTNRFRYTPALRLHLHKEPSCPLARRRGRALPGLYFQIWIRVPFGEDIVEFCHIRAVKSAAATAVFVFRACRPIRLAVTGAGARRATAGSRRNRAAASGRGDRH